MPEQKCIICGNIVKFNRGQKVATCEYCETRQEYDGEVEPVAYEEPVMQATPSLERARRIRVEEARHTIKFESGGEPRFGATASSKSTIRFGEIDKIEESEYPSEGYPKSGGFAKVFAILLLIALCASLIYIFYIAYKESTKKTPVYYANAYIDNPEWGQEIEVGQFVSDIDVIAEDPEIYSVEVDCCYYYDEEIGEEVYLYPDDIIEEEGCYYVVLKFKPEKGYEFDDDTDYYINDTDPIFMSGPEWVEAELYIENNYY